MLPINPFDMIRLSVNSAIMLGQAQAVITMRLMGLAGMWSVTPSENGRMVQEKLRAGLQANAAVQKAVLMGKSPIEIAEAALVPISRATAANVRRLTKRGPKVPR